MRETGRKDKSKKIPLYFKQTKNRKGNSRSLRYSLH